MDDLTMIVLQHLNESKFQETARTLERESGIFFNLKHLEEKVIAGEWEELEKYILGFTKIYDNKFSFEMFFQIRKQKYLEAVDRNESASAVDMLKKELRVFSSYYNDKLREMCYLLSMDNLRENAMFRDYVDAQTSRIDLVTALKKLVEANPKFCQKLAFPSFSPGSLVSMLKESLSINLDHPLADWAGKRADSLLEPAAASQALSLKRLLPQAAPMTVDYPIVDHDQLLKRLRSALSSDEVLGSSLTEAINVDDRNEENRPVYQQTVTRSPGRGVEKLKGEPPFPK